jgi:hypothetical protein
MQLAEKSAYKSKDNWAGSSEGLATLSKNWGYWAFTRGLQPAFSGASNGHVHYLRLTCVKRYSIFCCEWNARFPDKCSNNSLQIYFTTYSHLKKDLFHEGYNNKKLSFWETLGAAAMAYVVFTPPVHHSDQI